MDKRVRLIKAEELESLLELYKHLNPSDEELCINESLKNLWSDILKDSSLRYFVIEEDGKLISSCTLAIIKNLTRSAKPYGLIENVVTHKDYRNKGYATAILQKALDVCIENNCYKVMLMTSRKEESTLRFYEKAGFDRGTKTAFVKYLKE